VYSDGRQLTDDGKEDGRRTTEGGNVIKNEEKIWVINFKS